MRVAERATPVAAVIAALSTLACCLQLGFLGAVGLAGLSVWAQSLRGWFLGLAITLLVVGFVQLYRGRKQCRKRSPRKELRTHLSDWRADCCSRDGILWDVVAIYPKDARWDSAPAFIDGPVVHATPDAARQLSELSRGSR